MEKELEYLNKRIDDLEKQMDEVSPYSFENESYMEEYLILESIRDHIIKTKHLT